MVLRDIALPVPGPDHFLVRVEAAGLAFGDTLIVRGRYQVKPPLPFTPGSEVVGSIVAGAARGGPLAPGTRVAWPSARATWSSASRAAASRRCRPIGCCCTTPARWACCGAKCGSATQRWRAR